MNSPVSKSAPAAPPVALVTGASGGLGAAMARALARREWHVFATSRSARSGTGGGLVDEHVEPLFMDVTQESSIRAALARVSECGLGIDLLINNAGINVSGVVEEMPKEQGRAIMDTNFYGVVDTIRAVLPLMRARRRGTILTIGSLAAFVAPPGEAYYAAAKSALEGFLESFQYEATPFGVRVCLAEPGFIRTNLARGAVDISATCADYDKVRAQHSGQTAKPLLTIEEARRTCRAFIRLEVRMLPEHQILHERNLPCHSASACRCRIRRRSRLRAPSPIPMIILTYRRGSGWARSGAVGVSTCRHRGRPS